MINVQPLLFLFLIQFLIIFAGLSAFLFLRNRKLCALEALSKEETCRLKAEVEARTQESVELAKWKEMFLSLQVKFNQIREANSKLKESIARLIPEAERSKEFEQLMAEIEQNNRELDACIGTLKKENVHLGEETLSLKAHIDTLNQQLSQSVSKDEFDALNSRAKSLELKIEKLKKDLEDERAEHESLKKKHQWLEKEYNALYNNIQEDPSGGETSPAAQS